jgi:UDP-N-acetylmuramoyl-tripeptide--D-alanyl-D-alanine ligase
VTLEHAVLTLAGIAGSGLAAIRWLRVAQREHYLAGSVTRFAVRWWVGVMPNPLALVVGVVAAVIGFQWWPAGVGAIALLAAAPIGLGLKGRSSPLAWTARLERVAALAGVLTVATLVPSALFGVAPLVVLAVPVIIDLSLALLSPLERKMGDQWVEKAARGLERSGARVVAITGSYGKTSTKVMAAHLLSGLASTVASPASFNNRMGLARSINEGLAPGTEIFVAEMGIYGPGEIADLCSWIPPEVGVMTAIGPVHLERMKTEEAIAEAKREILARVRVGVINIDHPLLARIADEESTRIEVIRCSSAGSVVTGDVHADPVSGRVTVGGTDIGSFDHTALHAGNVACAVGIVVALGLDPALVSERLATIPPAPNRQVASISASGFTIIDDTFNSNPSGARSALARLAATRAVRRVLVTPGMVELGPIQERENRALAREAGSIVTDLVVVGRTNRAALLAGAEEAGLTSVIVVGTREEAVEWVRQNLAAGDAVLYENDLPDHFP